MAIRRPPTTFSDTISTADIADDAISGDKLANDIAISTTGNIATTGSGVITSPIIQTDSIKDDSGTRILASDSGSAWSWGEGLPEGTVLQVKNKYITDTHTTTTTDFVWDDTYLDVTAKADNSKYLVIFSGNGTPDGGSNEGDSIEGFGFAVDPAGGTSWTYFGGGTNTTNTTNTKFFITRFDQSGGSINRDAFYNNLFSGIGEYTSSVNAGTTLRFGIRYLHYYRSDHPNIKINAGGEPTGSNPYAGNLATSYSVFEIKT